MVSLKVVTVTVSVLALLVGEVGVVTTLTVLLSSLRKKGYMQQKIKQNKQCSIHQFLTYCTVLSLEVVTVTVSLLVVLVGEIGGTGLKVFLSTLNIKTKLCRVM